MWSGTGMFGDYVDRFGPIRSSTRDHPARRWDAPFPPNAEVPDARKHEEAVDVG
jgi:hypothetical protein